MIMDGLGMDGDESTDITRGPGKWNLSCSLIFGDIFK